MKKIKNMYLADGEELKGLSYITGLVLEMENGEFFAQHSTDVIETYSKVTGLTSPQTEENK